VRCLLRSNAMAATGLSKQVRFPETPFDPKELAAQAAWLRRLALSLRRDQAAADDAAQDAWPMTSEAAIGRITTREDPGVVSAIQYCVSRQMFLAASPSGSSTTKGDPGTSLTR